MRLKHFFILVSFMTFSGLIFGQQSNSLRTKSINNISDTIFLDSLIILQNTFIISDASGQKLSSTDYELNSEKAYVIITNKKLHLPLKIEYNVFPIDLRAAYYHKKWEEARHDSVRNQDLYTYYQNKAKKDDRALLG